MKDWSRVLRLLVLMAGGVLIVAAFFFGTLAALDYLYPKGPDAARASQARSLKAALERYREARGNYPFPYSDNPITDLKKELVEGGYLAAIPEDPITGTRNYNQYRYVSGDGKRYGMLFHLQFANGKVPAGAACLTGVGTLNAGWWGQPPDCPF